MPTMAQEGLCFFKLRDAPDIVPPVPAPAMKASTRPLDGLADVEGVFVTASIISGAVVYSCARGLFT